ncbi:J domain-containing protein [Pseudomonadales bacterium]|nr:J domain-containing protein [Pseudomonadales bacterium]
MYFQGLDKVEQIKNKYRQLAKENHPDLGGCEEAMKAINNAYELALKSCEGQTQTKKDGKTWTYRYNPENEKVAMHKILELIALDMHDVDIWLIGVWIWVEGTTKPYKDLLGRKGAKCIWHSKRKCWYWKPEGKRSRGRGKGSFDELAAKYGAKKFGEKRKSQPSLA